MNEFDLIARHFAPLAEGFPGGFGLKDDAAELTPPKGRKLVVTTDMLVEGTHFIGNEPAALIARKLLRVNLSDLSAKGATPMCYFLSIALRKEQAGDWIEHFATGLSEDQKRYDITLAGGDTTRTEGPASLSITAIGHVPDTGMLRRNSAEEGDIIYVTGTLGDAALGLQLIRGTLTLTEAESNHLIGRYLLPEPRTALASKLHVEAHACIDVSDGLLQDLDHICDSSGKGAEVFLASLPLSPGAERLVQETPDWLESIATGGDDYELLFTAHPARTDALAALAQKTGIPITPIGKITAGPGIDLLDQNNHKVTFSQSGWQHF